MSEQNTATKRGSADNLTQQAKEPNTQKIPLHVICVNIDNV